MITPKQVQDTIAACTYKPEWRIFAKGDLYTGKMFIQIEVQGVCSVSKKPTAWKTGKRYLSPYMCSQEIVGVIFSLVKAAEEHEMLEWFRYKGASIFNPHLNPDVLAEVASKNSSFVTRPDNQSMQMDD